MKPAIEIKNLSKKYLISHEIKPTYGTLRDNLGKMAKKPFKMLLGHSEEKEELWALKDVSFSIEKASIIGIIGRNGSGKSTLLKILSRIVTPTEGTATLQGTVASLLEVGTGFHPELTGRENIFLNGSILGMKKLEIQKRFDDIVEFAGTSSFLDTPVKFYSSGMYVRLAFAVAAHLESDILLVDEVLAVGDADFQKKSLGKMNQVARDGRTVVFVSHNVPMIQSLCNQAVLLDKGALVYQGDTKSVLDHYLNQSIQKNAVVEFKEPYPGNEVVRLRECSMLNPSGEITSDFDVTEPITIRFTVEVLDGKTPFTPNVGIKNGEGETVLVSSDQTSDLGHDQKHPPGTYIKSCIIPANLLNCDTYYVSVAASTMNPLKGHFWEQDILSFRVSEDIDKSAKTARGNYRAEIPGFIRPILSWDSTRK